MEDVLEALFAWTIELVVITPIIGSLIIVAIVKWMGKD